MIKYRQPLSQCGVSLHPPSICSPVTSLGNIRTLPKTNVSYKNNQLRKLIDIGALSEVD